MKYAINDMKYEIIKIKYKLNMKYKIIEYEIVNMKFN